MADRNAMGLLDAAAVLDDQAAGARPTALDCSSAHWRSTRSGAKKSWTVTSSMPRLASSCWPAAAGGRPRAGARRGRPGTRCPPGRGGSQGRIRTNVPMTSDGPDAWIIDTCDK